MFELEFEFTTYNIFHSIIVLHVCVCACSIKHTCMYGKVMCNLNKQVEQWCICNITIDSSVWKIPKRRVWRYPLPSHIFHNANSDYSCYHQWSHQHCLVSWFRSRRNWQRCGKQVYSVTITEMDVVVLFGTILCLNISIETFSTNVLACCAEAD